MSVDDEKAAAISCQAAASEALLDVDEWVSAWARQRYGSGPGEHAAQEAWKILSRTVYSDVQGKGTDGQDQADALTSYPVGAEQEHVAPKPDWYNVSAMVRAWELLVSVAEQRQASAPSDPLPTPLRYDVVNTGREVLAKVSNRLFNATVAANTSASLAAAMGPMLGVLEDADELLCTDNGFSMAEWISNARSWGDTAAEQDQLEWAARAQPSTWLPSCPPSMQPTSNRTRGICGSRSDLADYSNKQWAGLVNGYYRGRYECYNNTASAAFDAGKTVLDEGFAAAYNLCIDSWSWAWQNDYKGQKHPMCTPPIYDAVAVSKRLLAKYKESLR